MRGSLLWGSLLVFTACSSGAENPDGAGEGLTHADTHDTNLGWQDANSGEDLVRDAARDGGSADGTHRGDGSIDGPCTPDCAGRGCGTDGCGGTCGTGCVGEQTCTGSGQCAAISYPTTGREVGVDYHAIGSDFENDAFLTRYHRPEIRTAVRSQLTQLARDGATTVSTRLWMVTEPQTSGALAWKHHFPLSAQEVSNLRAYAQDVAAADLKLYLVFLYLWCADYREGTPQTALGHCGLSAAEYIGRIKRSIKEAVDSTASIFRADGRPVVERYFIDGEVMTAVSDADPAAALEKKNQRWFLKTLWPWFTGVIRRAGAIPSMYFILGGGEDQILEPNFKAATFPTLDGHRSMYWIYRTLRFLKEQGLALPDRVDFSCYPRPQVFNFATLVNRVFDDFSATIPGLLGRANVEFFVAETYYDAAGFDHNVAHRSFAAQYAKHPNFRGVTFWTSPYDTTRSPGVVSAPPYDFSGLTDPAPTMLHFDNSDFEQSATCGSGDGMANPAEYCSEWANGDLTGHSTGRSDLKPHQGGYSLRLHHQQCAATPCSGSAYPGLYVLSTNATNARAGWHVARFWGSYSAKDHAGGAALVEGDKVLDTTAMAQSDSFVEYLLLGKATTPSVQLRPQITSPPTNNVTAYFDTLH